MESEYYYSTPTTLFLHIQVPFLSVAYNYNSPPLLFSSTLAITMSELPDCTYKNDAVLITPATSTPNHTLYLSNIDDQKFLRFTIKYHYVFTKSVDTQILKESLSRVLVWYYPLAGRLRRCFENDDRKLQIECNGEGAVFAEANMDLSANEFVDFARNPNTSFRKLLYRVKAPSFLDIPPLVIQVLSLSLSLII